ncbi:MAG: hypothetical protein K2R98_16520 [Gemmataceae bacterium]|nr:hypothetical protein [Gemmataceae bacterium]
MAARAGNVAAAKLLFAYCSGKPPETPDPDRLDVDEWNLVKESSVPGRQMTWRGRQDAKPSANGTSSSTPALS